MWPFDSFKKKPVVVAATTISPGIQPPHLHAPHVHYTHTPHTPVVPAVSTPKSHDKPHGRLRRYLVDPVPSRPRSTDDDGVIPVMVGDFLVGELLGSMTAPSTEPASSGPTDDTSTFQGFGGGESGGAGAGGSWDAPADTSTSSSDTSSSSSDSGSSSDSSSNDFSSSSDSSFDSGSSGSDSSGF